MMKSNAIVSTSIGLSAAFVLAAGICFGHSQIVQQGDWGGSVAEAPLASDGDDPESSLPQQTMSPENRIEMFVGLEAKTEEWSIHITEAYIDVDGNLSHGGTPFYTAPLGYTFVVLGVQATNTSGSEQVFETDDTFAIDMDGEKWFNNPNAEMSVPGGYHPGDLVRSGQSINTNIIFLVPRDVSFDHIVFNRNGMLEP